MSSLRTRYLAAIHEATLRVHRETQGRGSPGDDAVEALCLLAATIACAQKRAGYSSEIVRLMAESALGAFDAILESKERN